MQRFKVNKKTAMQLANEKFKKFTDSMEKNKTGLKIQTTANIFAINPENQTTLVY